MRFVYNDLPSSSTTTNVELNKDFRVPKIEVSKSYFSAGGATKWCSDYQYALTKFFSTISKPYKLIVEIPFEEPLRSSIRRFLISLEAYSMSNNPLLTEREILSGVVLGPSYATYLKQVRFKSFLNTVKGTPLDYPEWWNEVPSYSLNDIGDIFNYQYLIHWEEDVDDYLKGNLPLYTEGKFLNKFRKELRIMLEDTTVDIIDSREILLSSSGSMTATSELKKTPTFKIKGSKENYLSERRKTSIRSVVQVHPEGARDAVINQLSDLNRIKLIEFQTAEVLKIFSSHTVNKDLSLFELKYEKFKKNHKWFLCRDLTKEGITKPRILLRIMLEELKAFYPEAEAFEYPGFFDDYEVLVKDEIFKPVRGHGLGMANSLTTLMQIIIFNMTIKRMKISTDSISLLTHNDDAIVGAKKRSEIEQFWDAEEDILKGLGLLRNPKKSFLAKGAGVFLEKYFYTNRSELNRKESYQRRELMMSFCATNITQAKQLVSSQVYIDRPLLVLHLEDIVSFWGYEFFQEEIQYPAFCGGWYNESIYGISTDLRRLENLPYDYRVVRAYEACKNSRIRPKYEKGSYIPPVYGLFPLQSSKIHEDFHGLFDIGSLYDVKTKYTSIKVNPELYIVAWDKLRKHRREIYLKSRPNYSFKAFIKRIMLEQDKDFILLDFMVEKTIKTVIYESSFEDPYMVSNPLLSYLSSLEKIDNIDPSKWGVIFANTSTINAKLTADQRKRLKVVFGNLSLTGKLRNDTSVLPEEDEDFILIQERTFATLPYLKVYSELETPYVPVPKLKYVNEKIKEKKTVWNRLLTVRQFLEFNKNLDSKNIFKFIMDKNMTNEEIDRFELGIQRVIEEKVPVEEQIEDVPDEEEETRREVRFIIVPSPENYRLYQTGVTTFGKALEMFRAIDQLQQNFKRLEFEFFQYKREDFIQEYHLLDDISKEIWNDVYGDPEASDHEESDIDPDEGFDLFG